MQVKYISLLAIMMIASLASSIFWLRGNLNGNSVIDREFWLELAEGAWRYFQPGIGVNAATGLHGAGLYWPYFTDWDLGIYIQAIIDAERLGILSRDGAWGANYRFEKILAFLENRELTDEGLPYLWYDSRDGRRYGNEPTNAADTGKLLASLSNLKLYRPNLAGRIDYVVYERTNYEPLKMAVDKARSSVGIYGYYIASGFAAFWPERYSTVAEAILNNIISAPTVETYGVELPKAQILWDPLLHSIYEFKPNVKLMELAKQIYLAHEARYKATGKYVAFSEGNTDLNEPSYVYEWVVLADGRTWVIKDPAKKDVQLTPIIYFKVAVGLLAIYNTEFTKSMVEYLKTLLPDPIFGYMDGVDENGRLVKTVIDKTNGLIISAARYATDILDLSRFPWPFIQDSVANNTLIVIGESKPHGPCDAAHTIDTLGGMLVTARLGLEASGGQLKTAMDGWLIVYNCSTGGTQILDTASNLILIGSPGVNLVAYHYNCLTNPNGRHVLPVLFYRNLTMGQNYLEVQASGKRYYMEFDGEGRLVADYATIQIIRDEYGRYVMLVYGLGAEGTRIASEILKNYDQWNLVGRAIVVKYYDSDGDERLDSVAIVEVI